MNPVLGWVKTNWLIVVFCVVMIAALVAGYIGSGMWSKSMRQDFQTRVQQQMQQVQGAKVNYSIPTLGTNEQAVSESAPPNAAKTAWFAERIRARVGQAERLVHVAEDFNRGRNLENSNRLEHVPLVRGLFPAPANEAASRLLRLDFRDVVVGRPGTPSALGDLLSRYGVGPSADLRRVETVLSDVLDREKESIRTETGADPTPEQEARIKAMLSQRRVQEYQRASRDLSMYGTERVFAGSTIPMGGASVAGAPDLQTCFMWQWDYWIASDVLAGLALANTDADGLRTDVDRSIVKRIDSIRIEPLDITPPDPNAFVEATAPPVTITGRPDASNTDYDVRYVNLRLVVSSERLPQVFDALARTNYMTVVGMDIEEVDAWNELRAGYYYGSENVVRVSLRVETIWLRSWTGPLMPEAIRTALGVVVPEPPAEDPGNG